VDWIYNFVASIPSGASLEKIHLLIFYGHDSHITLQTMEENKMGIDLLTLHTRATHGLQPLDVSVFGPLSVTSYMREHHGWYKPRDIGKKV